MGCITGGSMLNEIKRLDDEVRTLERVKDSIDVEIFSLMETKLELMTEIQHEFS